MLTHRALLEAVRPAKSSANLARACSTQRCVVAMAQDSLQETRDGEFRRTASTFRNHVSPDGEFKPAGVLVVSHA
jgi:hypothetical protein